MGMRNTFWGSALSGGLKSKVVVLVVVFVVVFTLGLGLFVVMLVLLLLLLLGRRFDCIHPQKPK